MLVITGGHKYIKSRSKNMFLTPQGRTAIIEQAKANVFGLRPLSLSPTNHETVLAAIKSPNNYVVENLRVIAMTQRIRE